jgi:hypothetical protein
MRVSPIEPLNPAQPARGRVAVKVLRGTVVGCPHGCEQNALAASSQRHRSLTGANRRPVPSFVMEDPRSTDPVVRWALRGAACFLFGLGVTFLTARASLCGDDPISGTGYRGIPITFLKRPPTWERDRDWRFHWSGLAFDAFFWATPSVGLFLVRDLVLTRRSARWAAQGKCPRCGYDLRGSTGRRCSECGAVIAEPQSRSVDDNQVAT